MNRYLTGSTAFPSVPQGVDLPVVSHVETKVAWHMRWTGQRRASVVVNNGICDVKNPRAKYGCRRAVRAILPKGVELEVWEPYKDEPTVIRGVAD